MDNLTVIVPFYNEVNYLYTSVNRLLNVNLFDQILLIDDCSDDGSHDVALQIKNEYPQIVEYYKTSFNTGKGGALNLAKKYITSKFVIIHDADLEYFPDDIIEMFEIVKQNPDALILGSRFIGNKERKNVYSRTVIANRTMSLFFSLINFVIITDVATCYKLMSSDFFKKINIKELGFSIEIEILSKFLKQSKNIIEIPIKYSGRSYLEGKKIKASDGFKYLFNTIKYRFVN